MVAGYINRPPGEIEPVYLEYLAKYAIATFKLGVELRNCIRTLLMDSRDVWGFVSSQWILQKIQKWGHQTHHIQLRAAIVLK